MIDWDFIVRTVNRRHKTDFGNRCELLKTLYSEHKSAEKVGALLFICPRSVRNAMREEGLEILPKGHRFPSKLEAILFGLGDVSNLTFNRILRHLGCSQDRAYKLLRKHKIKYRKLKGG